MWRKHQGLARTPESSWFPKRCRFGASPSVITKFSTHDRPPTKSVTTRLFMCVHVCDKCLCVSACGVASNEVCAPVISMCALSENVCFVLLVMMGFRFGFTYRRNCACFPNKCRRNVRARQDEAFLREKACFKRNHFVATGNP